MELDSHYRLQGPGIPHSKLRAIALIAVKECHQIAVIFSLVVVSWVETNLSSGHVVRESLCLDLVRVKVILHDTSEHSRLFVDFVLQMVLWHAPREPAVSVLSTHVVLVDLREVSEVLVKPLVRVLASSPV